MTRLDTAAWFWTPGAVDAEPLDDLFLGGLKPLSYRPPVSVSLLCSMRLPDNPTGMSHPSKKKRVDEDPDSAQRPVQPQRRRVWRACESCRRKKIKCDGNEPTCSQCSTSGSQCTWLQTKDRAALSRHYVQELEARLIQMEHIFGQIAPAIDIDSLPASAKALFAGSSTGSGTAGNAEASSSITASAYSAPRNAGSHSPPQSGSSPQVKVEEDEVESSGQLALDEHGHMRWIGRSSTMTLIQNFKALTTSPLNRVSPMEEDPRAPGPSVNKLYFPASVFFGKVHALPGPEEVEYPERDLADKLVDAYFSRFHFLMPVIDKPSFMRQYATLMDNTHDINMARTHTAFISLVFAVFACSARLVDDPRLEAEDRLDDGGMGMVYYERALILHYISHASIQPEHVQCFILMASFLCSVNCLPQAWLLVGQAVRTAQDLGFHRSPRRLLITSIEKETRRKIWWGVYSLDRMLALSLGRPLGIEDADCDVEWPVDVDDEELPEYFDGAQPQRKYPSLMTGYIALTQLYQIAGRVLREVYDIELCKDHLEEQKKAQLQRTVEELDSQLNKWCDDLPVVFKSEPVNEKQVSMGAVLCSHYYSVLTTLHRNFLPVKRDQPAAPKSTAKAVSSARSCIRLAPSIRNVVPPSHHLAFFIQHLFSSAVIILLYAMHATDPRAANAAMEEARNCLAALETWVGFWPGAYKCKELLTDLANTASEAIKTAQSGQQTPTVTSTPSSAAPLERRRSITVSTPSPPSSSRVIKNKPRRPKSRDPNAPTRRPPVSGPYRTDPQRARSTSRKRGHGETDGSEEPSLMSSYHSIFTSPNSLRSNLSNHSSPTSVDLPSPAMASLEIPQESSPRLVPNTTTFNYHNSNSTLSSQPSTSSQFDYQYGIPQQLPNISSGHQWPGNGDGDQDGMDIYSGSQQGGLFAYSGNAYGAPSEPNYLGYDDINGGGLSTASFAAPGLPFRGLDYIRNYNPETVGSGQDSLWQSFDPGAFGYDPELPFTALGDISETNDGRQ
ncbi:hypothetical protein PLICRDRAFT_34739 [Plicaturopsis crispa FD-325 SS-3]|nr:hypothetical protein PLICRDRAFT_34739 [Plicaturopsis crispa FD-325 SS-3]